MAVDLKDRRVAYYTRVQICIMCSCTLGDNDAGGSSSYLFCMKRLSRLMKSRLYAVFTSVSTSAVRVYRTSDLQSRMANESLDFALFILPLTPAAVEHI